MNGRTRTFRGGFTLIEILTVAALITLLVVMLLPALTKYRQLVKIHITQSRVNQLDLGCRQYFNEFNAYPASSGYGMQGSQLLAMFMTGIGYTPGTAASPGFKEKDGAVVHGPYGGAENLPMAGNPSFFIDALDKPILYYCSTDPALGGYNSGDNGSPTPGPSDINGYARGFASGPYLRKDFLIVNPGPDGQWCSSGTPVGKSDDVTNMFMNR
jgi:type II secretory pathway pseudopilin PulG